MQIVTGVFESGEAARGAVGRAREAGFGEDAVAFILARRDADCGPSAVEHAADAGRRFGALASDVGETAVQFLPFMGRSVARGPMAQALRRAAEDAGASAGRILDAAAEGIFAGGPESAQDPFLATVVIHATDGREDEAAALLTAAGAVETSVKSGDTA